MQLLAASGKPVHHALAVLGRAVTFERVEHAIGRPQGVDGKHLAPSLRARAHNSVEGAKLVFARVFVCRQEIQAHLADGAFARDQGA